MAQFRLILGATWIVLLGYTAAAIAREGASFLAVFFADMAAFGWPGQFNLDFMMILALAATRIAWWHGLPLAGFALGLCALFGGAGFLRLYLFVASLRAGDDPAALLMGAPRP